MKQMVVLVITVTLAAAALAAQSGLSQATTYGAQAGWKERAGIFLLTHWNPLQATFAVERRTL